MSGSYVIWNTKTGVYDGAYRDKGMALERYFDMSREDRGNHWILVDIVYPEKFQLADEKFHARQEETKQ